MVTTSFSRDRQIGSQISDTMAKLAEVWYEWRGNGGIGSVLKWCQVEDQIGVQCLKVADGFEIHQTAFALVKSDRWAQTSVYDVSTVDILAQVSIVVRNNLGTVSSQV